VLDIVGSVQHKLLGLLRNFKNGIVIKDTGRIIRPIPPYLAACFARLYLAKDWLYYVFHPEDAAMVWTVEILALYEQVLANEQRTCSDPEHVEQLECELQAFTLRQRVAIRLFFLGQNYHRIASLLGISPHEARSLSGASEEISQVHSHLADWFLC